MCIKFIYFHIFLLQLHSNNAVKFNVSAKMNSQSFVLHENEYPIAMQIIDIRNDVKTGECYGECKLNYKKSFVTHCNIHDEEFKYLDVVIVTRARKKYSGIWRCMFKIETGDQRRIEVFEYIQFNMTVKDIDVKSVILPSQFDKPPSLKMSSSCKSKQEAKKVVLNITNPNIINSFALHEGDQIDALNVIGIKNVLYFGSCTGWCEIKALMNITASFCNTTITEIENKPMEIAMVQFSQLNVKESYSGLWNCYIDLPLTTPMLNDLPLSFKINVTVNGSDEEIPIYTNEWLYIGIGLGVTSIVLIIIGQTICILYFKSKARKAEMVKNLSRTTSTTENSKDRYVNKKRGSEDSVIYEALETKENKPPIPPPIETLPAKLRPQHIRRSMSYNNLCQTTDFGPPRFNPHPNLSSLQHQRKNITADKFTSLDRIRNRPPQPLPTEDIYEVMKPGLSPELKKATSRFNKNVQDNSPLLAHNQSKSMNWNQSKIPKLNSPATGRKLPIPTPGQSGQLPGPSRAMVLHPLPGAGSKPVHSSQLSGSGKTPLKTMPVLGAMPVLPSMLSSAVLKPVKPKPPIEEPSKTANSRMTSENCFKMPLVDNSRVLPREDIRIPPGQGFIPQVDSQNSRILGNAFKMLPFNVRLSPRDDSRTPGNGFRMPVDARMPQEDSFKTVLSTKPKPPIPLPKQQEPETNEPSQDPGYYYGSSDEEFDSYDVLPDYRIYGNAPPKKFI